MTHRELVRCHQIVWEFRKKWEKYWWTPDRKNALRFAFTEAGEAMDAYQRERGFPRNNARNMNVLDELADLAIMLLTVFDPSYDHPHSGFGVMTIDRIVVGVADALASWEVMAVIQNAVYDALIGIAEYPGMNLEERIKMRLERIYRKHVEPNL